MIKIKKFENIYGIKELKESQLIEGNTIIYAPNGVMKTSFADGISNIANGIVPKDVFSMPNIEGKFIIEEDGNNLGNSNPDFKINAFVFNSGDYKANIFDDERLTSLVMTNELKEKYKICIDEFDEIKKIFIGIVSKTILNGKKSSKDDIMQSVFGEVNLKQILLKLPDLDNYKDEEYYQKIDFNTLFNPKVNETINLPEFIEKCKEYSSYIEAKLDEEVFTSGFSFDSLQKILKDLNKNNFFKAGHKIKLNTKEPMDYIQLNDYINDIIEKVYGSEEVLKKFNDAKSLLEKNSNVRDLMKIIKDDNRCLKELAEPQKFKKIVIYSKLSPFNDEIMELKSLLENCINELEKITSEAKKHKNKWQEIINDYNSRFITNKLDVKIVNYDDAVLGIEKLVFQRNIKDTEIEVTDENINRLSTGEKRAITLLNLIFEVELRKNKKFTLVLDDVSDSFDYKNKYAIIEYINDFSKNENIQLIILTHNFDFYRSLRILLNRQLKSRLIAYSNNGIVTLYDASDESFEKYSYYKNWKKQGSYMDVIACIPFLRNIVEMEKGSKDNDYKALTGLLHYNSDLENRDFLSFNDIIVNHNIEFKEKNKNKKYLESIKENTKTIINSEKAMETKLREKVVLGLFIRLFADRFMWKKYEKEYGKEPDIVGKQNESYELYNSIVEKLKEKEQKVILTARVVAPSFIHVNSFMFEPLVDVGMERLKKVASDVLELNDEIQN